MHKQFFKAWLSEEISKKRSKKGIELMLENSKSVSFAQMDLGLVMELLEQLIMVEQLIKLFIFIVDCFFYFGKIYSKIYFNECEVQIIA